MRIVLSDRPSRRRRARAGLSTLRGAGAEPSFTIVEVLIVVAMLVIIGSLAIPPVWRWVEEYRSRETMARFDAAMDACLARAQQRGAAMIVSVRSAGGVLRVESRPLERPPSDDEPAELGSASSASHGVYTFPGGYRFDEAESRGGAPAEARGAAPGAGEDGAGGRDIALLLPDGTAAAGEPLRLTDAHGRRSEIVVDRWGGSVRLRAAAPANGATTPDEAARP